MLDIINEVASGRWFQPPSPFTCIIQENHPKLCVITGHNASGKSLLRKVIHNKCLNRKIEYISLSQEQRCSSGGIERLFIYGTETDESTGYNSVRTLLKAIQTGLSREKPFAIMIDEPEIGCSEETQLAIGLKIAKEIGTMTNLHAMFVVTHSRQLVRPLLQATHWRLSDDKLTLPLWSRREVIPCDLEELVKDSKEKWRTVNEVMKL